MSIDVLAELCLLSFSLLFSSFVSDSISSRLQTELRHIKGFKRDLKLDQAAEQSTEAVLECKRPPRGSNRLVGLHLNFPVDVKLAKKELKLLRVLHEI